MKKRRTWPLFLISLPAAVAVWSGWVGLGALCGFGVIHPLPGIWDNLQLNTAITLPIGVEAYGGYALGVWADSSTPKRVRQFAFRSAIGSLLLGLLGQVVFHLLSASGYARAPWPVVVFVSCIPVAALGFGMGLHQLLIHADADEAPEPAAAPAPVLSRVETLDILARTITPAVPEPAPVHHEPPLPSGTVWEAPKPERWTDEPVPVRHEPEPPGEPAPSIPPDDFDREAAEVFGTAVPPARPEPASPPVRPPAKAPAGKWTPEAAGISLDELRELIRAKSRNELADHLSIGRSTASRVIREYGPVPALNGTGG